MNRHTMITKHWMATALDENDNVVHLYLTTCDMAIVTDLEQPEHASLIQLGRDETLVSDNTSERNHMNLAVGAFREHSRHRRLNNINDVKLVDAIPNGLTGYAMGGSNGTYLLNVYQR